MSQFPPPVPPPLVIYAQQPQRQPANVWAIVSLITGIIGCFIITPLVAIVTGLIGIGQSKKSGGRGMAITGLLLGILWIVGALGAGGTAYWGFKKVVATAKQPAIDTINALVAGDPTKAKQFSTLTDDEAAALSERLKGYGKCTDLSVSLNSITTTKNNGTDDIHVKGTATFETAGEKGFTATVSTGPQKAAGGPPLRVTELNVD
ncbi:MAG: hypothetical protein JWM57_611 [Phycisphaerales bacterium]|nr:hypothetical protein [Phycisphaerales bacterium]